MLNTTLIRFYRRLFPLILWLVAAILHCSSLNASPQHSPKWEIDFDAIRGIEGLKPELLHQALEKTGIAVQAGMTEEALKSYLIYGGQYFNIYLAPRSFTSDHVWILAKAPSVYEALSQQQLQELENFRYLIGKAYLSLLKYDGYLTFTDASKSYGFKEPRVCLEIIPTQTIAQGKINFLSKLHRVQYTLFQSNEHLQFLQNPQPEKIRNIIKRFISNHETLQSQKRLIKNTLPWTRKYINFHLIEQAAQEVLFQELAKQNVLFDRGVTHNHNIASHLEEKGDRGEFDTHVSEITKCAFCDRKVIENQIVYEGKNMVVLYNYKPYVYGHHFMVVPKPGLHVENFQDLSGEDIEEMSKLVQLVIKALQKDTNRDDIISFVQNGSSAGMTVPHAHQHILLLPTKVHLAAQILISLSAVKNKGLTKEESAPVRLKYKRLITELGKSQRK